MTSVDLSDASLATSVDDPADEADESLETAPRGRHSAHVAAAPESAPPAASGGRHSANRARSVRVSVPRASVSRSGGRRAVSGSGAAVLDGIELPSGAVTPEEVDALADRMLTRLAVTETRTGVLDPADLPGGKWGFAAAVMAGVVLLLLALSTVVGLLTNH